MQKVTQRFSFGRWLLCQTGLVHYLHPSDYELRKLAGHPQPKPKSADSKGKNKKKKNKDKDDNNFTVPRNLDFQLDSARSCLMMFFN